MDSDQKPKKTLNRRDLLRYGLAGALTAWLLPNLFSSWRSKNKPNIALIVLDTLRADSLYNGIKGSLVPNIKQIAQQGTLFANAFSPAPWTVPSHASIFTGQYPHKHNAVHEHFRLEKYSTTMAEILNSRGYRTAGFTCNPWLHETSGMEQGLETYEEIYKKQPKPYTDLGAQKATEMITTWINKYAGKRKPFFLFANYMEAHLPYDPPKRILASLDSKETGPLMNSFSVLPCEQAGAYVVNPRGYSSDWLARVSQLYNAEIAYLDEHIGTLLSCLRDSGTLDDTVLIITSDHGENLGEHNFIGHEFSLFNTVLHVPLIIRFPSAFTPGRVSTEPVSLIDVLPTILDIVPDCTKPADLDGLSLLRATPTQADSRRDILAEYSNPKTLINSYFHGKYPKADLSRYNVSLRSLQKGDFKYIRSGNGTESLYDILKDPAELNDISSQFTDQIEKLRLDLNRITPVRPQVRIL